MSDRVKVELYIEFACSNLPVEIAMMMLASNSDGVDGKNIKVYKSN